MDVGESEQLLLAARAAFERSDWREAFDTFRRIDAVSPLGVDDLERAALAATWLPESDRQAELLQRAFRLHVAADEPLRAVPVALELCLHNARRDRVAVAMGWADRAASLVAGHGPCAQLGQVIALRATATLDLEHDNEKALALFDEALALGRRFGDGDLVAQALVGSGTAMVRLGRVADGMHRVDEAMVDAVAGMLSPVMTARVYCGTISLCQATGDIRRAFEWTQEASSCALRPGMGDFPGDCRMHRAEILRLRGDWEEAESQLRDVMGVLGTWSDGHVGQAWYELGEIARRRGDLAA
jgi:tetratricopeptide (TPR) repeat protein